MHVSLFYKSSYLPLLPWFRNIGCVLKKKSVLENFPAYIKNYLEEKSLSNDLMTELNEIKYKKPVDRPKFSSNLLRYSLILRYTSAQAYKLLLEQFPLPSFSLLKKINKGGVEPLKSVKCLLNQNKIDRDVVLLMDEIYLQKEAQYQGGRMIGVDNEGILYKGVMTFMIVSLKKKFNFVIRAIPEVKIEGKWLADHVDECIMCLQENGFHVRGVVSDNHSTNVSAFSQLMHKYKNTNHVSSITHPTKKDSVIYLFFDVVHLLKNIRNNLLNSKRLIFPAFYFDQFHDVIDVHAGEISWKLLHDVYDRDQLLQSNLKKGFKLSYKSLHPGNNKQSVPLALAIFDPTTSAAIESYFPDRTDASSFLKLINIWWTISNSKQKYNNNYYIGNAAVLGDMKPLFLRNLAEWIEEWQLSQVSNSQKFTLSKQTSEALTTTLGCTASLIDDLIQEGYDYFLISRLLTDPLELRFSKYRQMSGGRFLIGLRELETSERILAVKTLLKESINIWEEDVRKESCNISLMK